MEIKSYTGPGARAMKRQIEEAGETEVQVYITDGNILITTGEYKGLRHMYISHAWKMISKKAVSKIVEALWGENVRYKLATRFIGADVWEVMK